MAIIRHYRGQRVRQSICVGNLIAIVVEGPEGQPCERLLLALQDYLADLKVTYQKKDKRASHPGMQVQAEPSNPLATPAGDS